MAALGSLLGGAWLEGNMRKRRGQVGEGPVSGDPLGVAAIGLTGDGEAGVGCEREWLCRGIRRTRPRGWLDMGAEGEESSTRTRILAWASQGRWKGEERNCVGCEWPRHAPPDTEHQLLKFRER